MYKYLIAAIFALAIPTASFAGVQDDLGIPDSAIPSQGGARSDQDPLELPGRDHSTIGPAHEETPGMNTMTPDRNLPDDNPGADLPERLPNVGD